MIATADPRGFAFGYVRTITRGSVPHVGHWFLMHILDARKEVEGQLCDGNAGFWRGQDGGIGGKIARFHVIFEWVQKCP